MLKYFKYSATMVEVLRISDVLPSSLNFFKPLDLSESFIPLMEGADISLPLLKFILNIFKVFLREAPFKIEELSYSVLSPDS